MSEMRHLSIVIPSYNARALLRRTLRTLQVAAPEAEVIVVDGRSRDGSPEMVRDEFPDVSLHRYENHGFAHAVNRGLEQASGEYILLLNSDLFVSKAALDAMIGRLAADRSVAAVAPILHNEDGTRQHLFGWPFGAFYWPNWLRVRNVSRVPLLNGACFMTRRDVLREIGAFDENFFLYNEEYDWCVRAQRAGYHLELVPEPVVHVGGGSTAPSPDLWLEAQRGFLYFTSKHGSPLATEMLRRAMQFQGFCYKRTDPRARHRAMWEKLESLTSREAYLESPFELSGRGDRPAQPMWQGLMRERPAAVVPETTTHAMPEAASEAPVENGASVVRLAAERLRIASRRLPKVAGAAG
ncbi:glycosyltransferase family 2 protein [Sandaracinus amylolyticus]|uniref:Glycosyl transferase, family 2 n=1 Tax=Sandaracinus amylolyticus TaxID=927083 RepID=A0A0F6SGZ4_9BACT|nr:Glycosyl transferase, family 2 [Sandaracinus amylolyticus]